MKTLNYIIILSILTFSATAQDKLEKTVEPFSSIAASGAVNIKYRISDTNQVILNGNDDDFTKIEFSNKDNTLFIHSTGTINDPLTITVTGNKLNEVVISGASSFKASQELQAPHFHINASGASNANINLNSNSVKAMVTGASDVSLKGTAHVFDATIAGAANVKAYDLKTDTCLVNASGASTAKVQIAQKANLNATGASTIKFKGEPKEISAEGSTSSKIMKIGTDGTSVNSLPNDTSKSKTTFKFRGKNIIIIDGDHPKADSLRHATAQRDYTREHWQGLWLGFGGYTNPQMGFSMNNPNKYMELDYGKSFNFQWNLTQKNLNLYKKYIQLSTGVGFEFNNLSFENKTRLNPDSSYTWGIIDSTNKYGYLKNRFKQTYVTVPLLLSFNTNKKLKKNVHLTCGVVGKYLLSSKTKTILELNGDEFTYKRKDGYNLNPFQFNAYASVGYRNFTVFAQYALTEMFKANKGPQLYPFAVGVRLISFD